jgi:hypothetical protein
MFSYPEYFDSRLGLGAGKAVVLQCQVVTFVFF